ncbi:NAD+ synthase, partial [bacterium]|nr:NAD+ synthase [bacterium]
AKVDVVLFPELAVCGYPPEDLLLKPHFIRSCEESLYRISEHVHDIIAVIGTPILDDDVYNAAAVCAEGEVNEIYRKNHLPNYGVFDERRYFAAGDEALVVNVGDAVLGLTVCEDIWIADGPQNDCVGSGGAQLILNISASPFHAQKTQERERMLRQRALDNGTYVVFCNTIGGQDELVFDGASCVIDHEGNIIGRASAFEEEMLVVDVDPEAVIRARLRDGRHREWAAASRAIGRVVDEIAVPLESKGMRSLARERIQPVPDDITLILAALEVGLRDYVHKNGFEEVTLGISGGVDSALVAAVACRALGAENVHGIFMPSKYSSSDSMEDAEELAANFNFALATIPIFQAVEAFDEMLSDAFAGQTPDVTEENIQARIRGVILMAHSNKFRRLVLATGNKTEMSVGYATLYGDMCGAFAPVKDVSKLQIYALCERINTLAGRDLIPRRILTKAPTAELRENQKDTDSLPPYEELDRILSCYIEEEMSYDQIIAEGFDAATVVRVIRLVNSSEYKRRQAPPGVKVSPLALGKDRRIPITNHFGRVEVPSAIPVNAPQRDTPAKS